MRRLYSPRRSLFKFGGVVAAEVQQLEGRTLPAGVVNVAIAANGNVTITGDNSSNTIDIDVTAGSIVITPDATTRVKVGGVTADAGEAVQVTEEGDDVDGNLKIDMKGGNDVVRLTVTGTETNITGNVSVKMGSGADTLDILVVAEDVDPDPVLEDFQGNINVEGNVNIDMGTGNNVDKVRIDSSDDDAGILGIGGHLTIKTHSGNDVVALFDVDVVKNVTINSGLGHDDVLQVDGLEVGGNLTLTYGDLNYLENVAVGGNTKVNSGTGDDRFGVTGFTGAGKVDVDLGSGADQLAIGTIGEGFASVKLNGGTGTDDLDTNTVLEGVTPKSFENVSDDADAALAAIEAAVVAAVDAAFVV